MRILESGGNAFDAAAAAGFVLQVVEPHFNGPGGDVSIVALRAGAESADAICGQGPMPGRAAPEVFAALGLTHIPGSGLLPACVPGAFGGWLRLLAEFGTLRVADVLGPAIEYAEHGYPLLPETALAVEILAPLFRAEWKGSAEVWLPHGRVPKADSRFRNPALAHTYRRIIKEAESASANRESQIAAAHDAFYRGFVAEEITEFLAGGAVLDATGRRHRALLTADDLAGWQPSVEKAVSLDYRGHRVYKPGPWSQGPVFLQQLALLEGFDLAGMGAGGADFLHTVVECAKLAFADREAWYGDPDFGEVPLPALLGAEYSGRRRALVGPAADRTLRPGAPGGRTPWIPPSPPGTEPETDPGAEWMTQLRNGLPTVLRATEAKGDTCCVTVTDRRGNTVAATPSGGWLKSSPAMAGLGFALGTRGQTMHLAGGHPNSLAPGKRPRTTLSPTVVQREGEPFAAFGTPGGDRQDQWTLQFFLAVADFGLDLQAATETLAFHTDQIPASFTPRLSRPGVLVVEDNCDPATAAELRRRGHEVEPVPAWTLGRVCATGYGPHGFVRAAASPRGRRPYAICG